MAALRKCLSHDTIDHISQTWCFLLLLLLSIIFLFVPLIPSMGLNHYQPIGQAIEIKGQTFFIPKNQEYTATCWVPAEFTQSMLLYSNAVCASAFNAIIQGKDPHKSKEGAQIHRIIDNTDGGNNTPKTKVLTIEDLFDEDANTDQSNQNKDKTIKLNYGRTLLLRELWALKNDRNIMHRDLRHLISLRTPLYLFIIALCLQLPYGIWSLISTCCGNMNVDQTLTMLQSGQASNAVTQERLKEVLGKSSKKSSALTYLVMKFLMIAVLCILAVVVYRSLLQETDMFKDKLNVMRRREDALDIASSQMNAKANNMKRTFESETVSSVLQNALLNEAFICSLNVRQLADNVHFSHQCTFQLKHQDKSALVESGSFNTDPSTLELKHEETIVMLYKALFTILCVLFGVLAVSNILSFVTWLLKLTVSSCRSGMGLFPNSSLDVAFMVAMAWTNTSATVAMEIIACSKRSKSYHDEGAEGDSVKMS